MKQFIEQLRSLGHDLKYEYNPIEERVYCVITKGHQIVDLVVADGLDMKKKMKALIDGIKADHGKEDED